MRAAIRQLFPSRACRTLVRPATDEEAVRHAVGLTTAQLRPEFVSQLEAVHRRPFGPYLRPPPHYSPSLSCPRPPPSGPPRTRRRRSSARLLSRRPSRHGPLHGRSGRGPPLGHAPSSASSRALGLCLRCAPSSCLVRRSRRSTECHSTGRAFSASRHSAAAGCKALCPCVTTAPHLRPGPPRAQAAPALRTSPSSPPPGT